MRGHLEMPPGQGLGLLAGPGVLLEVFYHSPDLIQRTDSAQGYFRAVRQVEAEIVEGFEFQTFE